MEIRRLKDHIKLGEGLQVEFEGKTYSTKLLDFSDDLTFMVYRPTFRLRGLSMLSDDMAHFTLARPDGVYEFKALFVKSQLLNKLHVYYFRARPRITKSQRRQSYRLTIMLPLKAWCLKEDDPEPLVASLMTINISETGLLFGCPCQYEPGQRLGLELDLGDAEPVQLEGRVVRCENPLDEDDLYRVAVELLAVSNPIRKQIARFILKRQSSLRKKDN